MTNFREDLTNVVSAALPSDTTVAVANVAFLQNVKKTCGLQNMPLKTALGWIASDMYKERVLSLRGVLETQGEKAYKLEKVKLPTIHFNGTFDKQVTNDCFATSSGLFHFDVDQLNQQQLENVKATIINHTSTVFCFVSPSGNGLKGALRIDPNLVTNDSDFKAVFACCERFFKQHDINIDTSCKDVRRACFVSHDPNIYVNFDAEVFDVTREQPVNTGNLLDIDLTLDVETICITRVEQILKHAVVGSRHNARVRAGHLAGGFVAGGLIQQDKMFQALQQYSDSIADGGVTNIGEAKTLFDTFVEGMKTPITDISKKNDDVSRYIDNNINITRQQNQTANKKQSIPEIDAYRICARAWCSGAAVVLDTHHDTGRFSTPRYMLDVTHTAPFFETAANSVSEADFLVTKIPSYITKRVALVEKENAERIAKGETPQADISEKTITDRAKEFAALVNASDPADDDMVAIYSAPVKEVIDTNKPTPKANSNMLYGFAGRVAKAAADGTEVNEYATFLFFLTFLSASFGRDIYLPIGNSFHHSRLFGLHVGRSSKGRKGDAMTLVDRICNQIHEIELKNHTGELLIPESSHCKIHKGGLSSREGLVLFIHDGLNIGTKNEIPAVDDKRLLCVESEFANVLHQTKRDGNTLSTALRDLYDGRDIKPAVKNSPIGATDPHVAMWVSITPSELLELMADRELANGFANRFIPIFAERYTLISMPKPTPYSVVLALALEALDIIKWAKGAYPAFKNSREAQLSDDAKVLYDRIYKSIEGTNNGNLSDLFARQSTNLLRTALTLAIMDKSLMVEKHHIEVAYEWIKFSGDSVRYIFASNDDEAHRYEVEDVGSKILEFLGKQGHVSKQDLYSRCFQNKIQAVVLDDALNYLLSCTPPKIELNHLKRSDGKFGRQKKVYCVAKLAKLAKLEETRGFAGINLGCELS